jgi:hypothetical protein
LSLQTLRSLSFDQNATKTTANPNAQNKTGSEASGIQKNTGLSVNQFKIVMFPIILG